MIFAGIDNNMRPGIFGEEGSPSGSAVGWKLYARAKYGI